MFIFFTCIKKTNQKKVQPITWSRKRDCPALLAKHGQHRKVAALRRVAVPLFAVLLSGVRWHLKNTLTTDKHRLGQTETDANKTDLALFAGSQVVGIQSCRRLLINVSIIGSHRYPINKSTIDRLTRKEILNTREVTTISLCRSHNEHIFCRFSSVSICGFKKSCFSLIPLNFSRHLERLLSRRDLVLRFLTFVRNDLLTLCLYTLV
jgi:hypothetical protein